MRVSSTLLTSLLFLSLCHEISADVSVGQPGSFTNVTAPSSCRDVYNEKPEIQCAFASEYCTSTDQIGRFNYLKFYYCKCQALAGFSVLPLIVILCIFFVSLGLTASDYLCPNLYTISKNLNLSDNIAGLTLLAMGNGSPDVLSTYSAMNAQSGSLAVSELFGASLFITSIVIGSMAMIKPFKVPKKSFLRDGGFFLLVTLIFLVILSDSNISTADCIILLGVYAFYVTASILSHSYMTLVAKRKLQDARARSHYSVNSLRDEDPVTVSDTDDIYLDNFTNLPTIEELHLEHNGRNVAEEDVIDEEYGTFLRTQSSAHTQGIPVETGTYGLKLLLKELSKYSRLQGQVKLDTKRTLTAPVETGSIPLYDENRNIAQTSPPSFSQAYEDDVDHVDMLDDQGTSNSSVDADTGPTGLEDNYNYSMLYRLKMIKVSNLFGRSNSNIISLLFPTLVDFDRLSILSRIRVASLLPVSFALRLTSPVRDQTTITYFKKRFQIIASTSPFEDDIENEEEEDLEFDFEIDKKLLQIQWVAGSNFMSCLIFGDKERFWWVYLPLSLTLSLVAYAYIEAIYSMSRATSRSMKYLNMMNFLSSVLGFTVSISWISIFATEIVSILKSTATIFDLSDDLLGVTIFALGNSIGDFISNFTIAKMGMPMMAFGACFGGPLLSICSIGFVGLLVINKEGLENGYEIEFSGTLVTTALMSVWNITIMMILLSLNDWTLDRRIGSVLILNWCFSTFLCIMYELNG